MAEVIELEIDKLYRVKAGSSSKGINNLEGGSKPTITFRGVSGTIKSYGSNKLPATLSEMVTETVDDITADKNWKIDGLVEYIAFAGGTATAIIPNSSLKFEDLGAIS